MLKGKSICFITVRNISYISSLYKYESILGNNYDMICWNRFDLDESCQADSIFSYGGEYLDDMPIGQKIRAYLGFRKYVLDILKRNKYKKIILLPTQAAILLADQLIFRFKDSYVLDIRDYTAENNFFFRILMNRLVINAGIVSLTSPAFMKFLPGKEYVISHNWVPIDKELVSQYRSKHNILKPIQIKCIGGIRFFSFFKKIIKIFGGDDRFILSFIGEGAELLNSFVKEIGVENICLQGRFEKQQVLDLFFDSDICNNLFGYGSPLLDFALSNRFYFAVQFGMPILACPNTYTEEIVMKYGVGFSFDENDPKIVDKLWSYYNHIDWEIFYSNCDKFFSEIKIDENNFVRKMSNFLLDNR